MYMSACLYLQYMLLLKAAHVLVPPEMLVMGVFGVFLLQCV